MKQLAAIVIPFYKNKLSASEKISLDQCKKILTNYPIYFALPKSIKPDYLTEDDKVVYFNDLCFSSIAEYNRLVSSVEFYEHFLDYEYLLFHQLDAYIFKDQLTDWCAKGYDYIGAPKLKLKHFKQKSPFQWLIFDPILFNGGLSLRRIKPIIRYLRIYHWLYPNWPGNEDMLFSCFSKRIFPLRFLLKLPPWKEGIAFAIEKNPQISFHLLGDSLPFGCHAWEKYNPKFWQKFIP